MKLMIKNFWRFNDYATDFFKHHEKQMVECWDEVGGKYFFKFKFVNIEWTVSLSTETDFMPGWPVEVSAYNYDIGAQWKLSETNVRHEVVSDKKLWCQFLDELITSNYIHHRNILTR